MRLAGAKIGKDCDIESGIRFHNCTNLNNLTIGNNCHIGKDCFFDLREAIIIGNNVVISMQCTFITHIDMSKSSLSNFYPASKDKIVVEDNVYIGVGTTVLKGVILASNSFVAANSTVLGNAKTYTLVGGSPAKFIKNIN